MSRSRLDKLLGNLGYGTRKDIARLASAGLITLDGAVVTDASTQVQVGPDLPARMRVRGKPVDPPAPLTLVVHKPLGLVCSHKESGRSVYDLFPERWRARDPALSTVGRLDKETSGLLIVTDDGALLHRIISPRSQVTKRYHVTLDRPLTGTEGPLFAAGELVLEGDKSPLAPAELQPLSQTTAWLILGEGRYHQVRRMFAAVGNYVNALHRDKVGALDLPVDLAPGDWRVMTDGELAAVFAA